jgi:hypothetical protein
VEFSLVFPLFLLVMFSIIVFGLYVFYNQQLESAARDAARYAATTSATAQCPTVSHLDPPDSLKKDSYNRCDAPENNWPKLNAAAKSKIWGMRASDVRIAPCWSGFVDPSNNSDALPIPPNVFTNCTIGGIDPRANPEALSCPPPAMLPSAPYKANGDDKASSTSAVDAQTYPTTVTIYVCYQWVPPMSGFLFIPPSITLRAVISEVLQRQQ